MNGYTVVEYNWQAPTEDFPDRTTMRLLRCVTTGIDQVPVMDASGTDLLYWQFTIKVTGLLHGEPEWLQQYHESAGLGAYVGSGAAIEHRGVREAATRGAFRMRVGVRDGANPDPGTVLFEARPWPRENVAQPLADGNWGEYDLNDGPRMTSFSVTRNTNNQVMEVSAEFVLCLQELGRAEHSGVLSNRWTTVDAIDENWYTTRYHVGQLKVMSNQLTLNAFRAVVVPPVAAGMRRMSMQFTAAPDGKTLDWSIVDKEAVWAAPEPATSWRIQHTVTSNQAAVSIATLQVNLVGDRNASKQELLRIAMHVLQMKLLGGFNAGGNPLTNGIILELSITDETGDVNAVHLSARVQKIPAKDANPANPQDFIFATQQEIGVSPIDPAVIDGYDNRFSRGGRVGEAIPIEGPIQLVGAFRTYLQNHLDNVGNLSEATAYDTARYAGSAVTPYPPRQYDGVGPSVTAAIGITRPAPNYEHVSTDHTSGPFTAYQVESLYRHRGMKAAMLRSLPDPEAEEPEEEGEEEEEEDQVLDDVVVVQLGPGVTRRIVRVQAERIGAWPILPEPLDYVIFQYDGANGGSPGYAGKAIVNDWKFLPGTTERLVGGQRIYRASMEIEYILTRTPDLRKPLRVGANPWDTIGMQMTVGTMFRDENTPGTTTEEQPV